jgi:hypothetical protein
MRDSIYGKLIKMSFDSGRNGIDSNVMINIVNECVEVRKKRKERLSHFG